MDRVRRTDRITLDASRARRHSSGAMTVPASVSRTGLQRYRKADGTVVVEYRPDAEVFAPAALESLRGAPVTVGHPPEGVQPHTLAQLSVGLVSDRDPARVEREGVAWVDTAMTLTSPDVQARAAKGELVELSLGYDAEIDPTPGVTPTGERYDCVQRNIIVNHCALLPPGQARAGREARLRLDGGEDVCNTPEQDHMSEPQKPIVKVRIDGVDVVEHSAEHFALVNKQLDAANARATKAEADLAAAQAATAAVQAKADGLGAELEAARKVNVSALVADELKFRAAAAPLLAKDYAFEGKDRAQIKRDAIGAEAVKRVDAQPEAVRGAYLDAAFDLALELKSKAGPSYAPPARPEPKQDDDRSIEARSARFFNEGRK